MDLLDLRGMRCPLPVLKLEAAMRKAAGDQAFRVLADDPLARLDLPHAARGAGWACKEEEAPAGAFAFRISQSR